MDTSYYVDTSYGYNAASASGLVGGMLIFMIIIWIISIAASVLMLVSMWKVFKKLGKPGWASIVPFYNVYVLCCEIAEKEWWYILLLCVPIANIYAMYVIYNAIAKKFGKETGFTIGMMLLPIVFFPILAFSKDANPVYETASNEEPKVDTMASGNTFMQNETNSLQNSGMQNMDLEKTQIGIGQNEGIVNNFSNTNGLGSIPVMPIQNNTDIENNDTNLNQVSSLESEPLNYGSTFNGESTKLDVAVGQENTETLNQTDGLYQAPTFDNNTEIINPNNTVGEVANYNTNLQGDYNMQANEPNISANFNSAPSKTSLNESVNNQINEATLTPNFGSFNQSVNEVQTNYETAPVMEQNINEPINNQNFTNESITFGQNVQENMMPSEEKTPVDNPSNGGHTSLWSNNNQNNTQI